MHDTAFQPACVVSNPFWKFQFPAKIFYFAKLKVLHWAADITSIFILLLHLIIYWSFISSQLQKQQLFILHYTFLVNGLLCYALQVELQSHFRYNLCPTDIIFWYYTYLQRFQKSEHQQKRKLFFEFSSWICFL